VEVGIVRMNRTRLGLSLPLIGINVGVLHD
jgi:hypothetical protein